MASQSIKVTVRMPRGGRVGQSGRGGRGGTRKG